MNLRFAMRHARRESRSSFRRIGFYMGAITLGVAALVAINSFRGNIIDAINIPQASLDSRIGELESYRERPLVVACKMGQQAGAAGNILRKAGFANVMRLSGGMTEWRSSNLPVVKG